MVNLGLTPRPDRIHRPRTRAARAFLLCSLVFLVTVAYFLLFPAKIGGIWHLFNGNTATYKAWTVPVPEGFFAMQRKGSLFIGRIERPLVISKGEYDILVVVTAPSSN